MVFCPLAGRNSGFATGSFGPRAAFAVTPSFGRPSGSRVRGGRGTLPLRLGVGWSLPTASGSWRSQRRPPRTSGELGQVSVDVSRVTALFADDPHPARPCGSDAAGSVGSERRTLGRPEHERLLAKQTCCLDRVVESDLRRVRAVYPTIWRSWGR